MSDTAQRKKICLECHRYPCACDTAPQPPPGEREVRQVVLSPLGIAVRDRIAALEAQLAAVQQANVMARDIALQANQRAEKAERELAEAQACPACHGTGEVLPAGPSDAPVEFCVECVKGLTLTCDFYRKRLGVQKGELAEAQDRLAMAQRLVDSILRREPQLKAGHLTAAATIISRAREVQSATAEAVAQHTASVERRGAARLQQRVAAWVRSRIGDEHMQPKERALRLLEETCELAQAHGIPQESAIKQVEHVFSRPAGEPAKEAAGVAVCLLGWCEATEQNLIDLAVAEIERIEAKPISQIHGSVARKASAGLIACEARAAELEGA